MSEEIVELKELLNKALIKLYENDHRLILRSVHERSITFRFGIYFEELVKESSFSRLNVDAEYNKNGDFPKNTSSRLKGTQPDILLHERENNDNNKLIIEFKLHSNFNKKTRNADIEKIEYFTSHNGEYKYIFGAFIELNREQPSIKYFINGAEEKIGYE